LKALTIDCKFVIILSVLTDKYHIRGRANSGYKPSTNLTDGLSLTIRKLQIQKKFLK
jgi:hypothetical protein